MNQILKKTSGIALGVLVISVGLFLRNNKIISMVSDDKGSNIKGKSIVKFQQKGDHFSSSLLSNRDRSNPDLTDLELKEFVKDLDKIFGFLVIGGVNEEEINRQLSKLNERREAGVRAILKILSSAPAYDSQVRERISMVDYLVYRARWDEDTRAQILQLAIREIDPSISPKLKGAMVVERAEIIGKIAAFDWHASSQALQSLELPSARKVAAAESVFALTDQGIPLDEARKMVKEKIPEYAIASQN